MTKKKYLLLSLVTLSVLSCRLDSVFIMQPAEAAEVIKDPPGLLPFSKNLLRVIEADLDNAFTGKLLQGRSASFSYESLNALLNKNESCTDVSLSKRTETVTESFMEINCPQIKGTKEVQNAKGGDTWTFTAGSSLTIYEKDQTYELRDHSILRFSKDGDLRLEKDYEDKKHDIASSSSIAGSLNYDLLASGSLDLDGTATLYQDSRPARVIVIEAIDMKYDSCGLKEGVVTLSAGKERLTMTFKNCQHTTTTAQ